MRDREREMAEEMRLHLEHRIEQKVSAGLSPDDARAAALREFGNVEAVKLTAREQRRSWRIATVARDIAFGLRVLRRHPGFATTAILTLALGVGANVAVFSVVRAVLLEELRFPDAGRVVSIALRYELMKQHDLTVEQMQAVDLGAPAIRTISGSTSTLMAIRGDADTERAYVEQVLPEFFEVFNVAPLLGRTLGAAEIVAEARAAVISDNLWRRQFNGRPDLAALRLRIGADTYDVVGVMPPHFYPNPSTYIDVDLWIPAPAALRASRRQIRTVARVAPEASIDDAETQVAGVINQRRPRDIEFSDRVRRYLGASVAPLGADDIAAVKPGLVMLQGISAFLLVITCANLANVFLTHATTRRRELSVRAALGASRARLVGQLLTEATVIAAGGAILGLAIALVTTPMLTARAVNVLPHNVPVAIQTPELIIAAAAAALSVLFFAGIPALIAARAEPFADMRESGTGTATRGVRVFRAGLVTAQSLLAMAVLTGAALLTRSFAKIVSQPLGFNPRGLVTGELELPTSSPAWREEARAFARRLDDELKSRVGGGDVVVVEHMPYNSTVLSSEYVLTLAGAHAPLKIGMADSRTTKPGALEFLGVPLVRGRAFADRDTAAAPPVALVNEAFVNEFAAGRDLLGAQIRNNNNRLDMPPLTIVGVVADTRARSRSLADRAAVYRPLDQWPAFRMTMALRGVTVGAATTAMREAVRALDANLPVTSIGAVEEKIGAAERRRQFYLSMLVVFAILAVSLAAVGIYGVVAHVTARRAREMGIRLALGARPRGLVRMVVRQSMLPIGLGISAGLVGAWWLAALMQSNPVFKAQLFQITAHDPVTFIAVPCTLFVVATIACWIPARRAAAVAVTEILKD